ncbi:MAG: hypothetical protein D4R64_17525 [Porphyromonadaceae bacterium]|nr:MAG: hypothetical protein D4R64_17525 [Porphyromonadaceae bacterium]
MIRKITNSVLVLVLLLTTTGFTYHYHYCCHTLVKFSILHTPKPCCENPEDCCSDKAVTLQYKTDYLLAAHFLDLSVAGIDLQLVAFDLEDIQPIEVDQQKFPEESPPPRVSVRLALLQQYLI